MVLILKDKLSEVFLGWYFGEKRTCPPLKSEYNFLAKSAKELANLIETKQITSTQLIKATIDRMNEVNGVLNAIVDGPFVAEALREVSEHPNSVPSMHHPFKITQNPNIKKNIFNFRHNLLTNELQTTKYLKVNK